MIERTPNYLPSRAWMMSHNSSYQPGNYTVGGYVWFLSPGVITGIVFHAPVGAYTIRVSLRAPVTGAVLRTKDIACSGPAWYQYEFETPYEITLAHIQVTPNTSTQLHTIQLYETSGTKWIYSGPRGNLYHDHCSWRHMVTQQSSRTAGDTWIGAGGTENTDCPVDVIGYGFAEEYTPPSPPSGGDLAGGPRFRCGFDPDRRSGPRGEDGSLQSDLLIATGVQNIAQFDGGTLED